MIYLQVHPDLMRPPGFDRYLGDAQLPVERHRRHHGQRPARSDVGLNGRHRHHALPVSGVPADGYVDRRGLAGVAHADREVGFRYLEAGKKNKRVQ